MIIDPSALEAYREVMEDEADEFIAEILSLFYTNARELLARLESTLAENDVEVFVRTAHTFKTTSATVGAQRVSSLLADLEMRGETEPLSDLLPIISELKEAYEEADSKLKELYA